MIRFIDEINRILWACDRLGPDGAEMESLLQMCSSIVIRARLPNHLETIEFCEKIGLVKLEDKRIRLTPLGKALWAANPIQRYELTETQKEIFITSCVLTDIFRSDLRDLSAQFSPDYSANTLIRSKVDDPPLSGDPALFESLKDLGLVVETQTELRIDAKHARSLISFASGALGLSELKQILALQERVGDFAEQAVLSFERNRLRVAGCQTEAKLVRRISGLDATAGFDIISFDGKSEDMIHNRFIEVKGSTKSQLDFFLTRNELETAKRLGKKYWIYFVGGIDLDTAIVNEEPTVLQDPYDLLNAGKLKAEWQLYHVTKSSI